MTVIKIHDVMHDAVEFTPSDVEDEMLRMCTDDRVEDVRIAKGYRNSPVYITLADEPNISIDSAKSIARQILREFEREVPSVDIDHCLRDKNIRLE